MTESICTKDVIKKKQCVLFGIYLFYLKIIAIFGITV